MAICKSTQSYHTEHCAFLPACHLEQKKQMSTTFQTTLQNYEHHSKMLIPAVMVNLLFYILKLLKTVVKKCLEMSIIEV